MKDVEWNFDDDQFSFDETIALLNQSETEYQTKPPPKGLTRDDGKTSTDNSCLRFTKKHDDDHPTGTIKTFFSKKPDKIENHDKRPRSSLLDCLDDDFMRKSPAKIKRNSKSPKKIVISIPDSKTERKADGTKETNTDVIVDESKFDEKEITSIDIDSVHITDDEDIEQQEKDEKNGCGQSNQRSKDIFEDCESGDEIGETVHDSGESKPKINTESTKNMKKQQTMFRNFFITNNSAPPMVEKKSISSDEETSPNQSKLDSSPVDTNSKVSSLKSPNKQDAIDADLLTDDEDSDSEINNEIDHLKCMRVESEPTLQKK